METKEIRLNKIVAVLAKTYPHPVIALQYQNPFELLVATILSAQCTDEVVNRVTPGLFRRYPTAAQLAGANQEDVEALIRSTGFFRNKAKNIIGMARILVSRFKGNVPTEMEAMLALPGVARKTANVVLGFAFGIIEGIVVDTHVKRLSARLGFTQQSNPEKIEQDLMRLLPKKEWQSFSMRLIYHGRQICEAKKPRCPQCPLKTLCPSAV